MTKNSKRQSERSQNVNRKDLKSQDKERKKSWSEVEISSKRPGSLEKIWTSSASAFKNEPAKSSHNSNKYHLEERRGWEDCKRNRAVSNHSFQEGRCPSSLLASRTHKHVIPRKLMLCTQRGKCLSEQKGTELKKEEKGNERTRRENKHIRNEERVPPGHLQKTNKETKKTTTDLKRQNEPKNDEGSL